VVDLRPWHRSVLRRCRGANIHGHPVDGMGWLSHAAKECDEEVSLSDRERRRSSVADDRQHHLLGTRCTDRFLRYPFIEVNSKQRQGLQNNCGESDSFTRPPLAIYRQAIFEAAGAEPRYPIWNVAA
jgi:hypothetical protein